MTEHSIYVELNFIDLFDIISLTEEWSLRILVGVTKQSLTCFKNESEVVIKSSIWRYIEVLNDLQEKNEGLLK